MQLQVPLLNNYMRPDRYSTDIAKDGIQYILQYQIETLFCTFQFIIL